jgi:hypothetical protein
MREGRTPKSVRRALGKGRPYRDPLTSSERIAVQIIVRDEIERPAPMDGTGGSGPSSRIATGEGLQRRPGTLAPSAGVAQKPVWRPV